MTSKQSSIKIQSISTPCRIVFDTSQATCSGTSLNDLLAKGRNTMNRLMEIMIRWSMHRVGFHTDVAKMYNSVKLNEEHWCLQRYIWQQHLDPSLIPEEKVIKTLVEIKQNVESERPLEYSRMNNIVKKDIYANDCISREVSTKAAFQRAERFYAEVDSDSKGGFTFSGESLLRKICLSRGGSSIFLTGYT